jgi:hypothetical protein
MKFDPVRDGGGFSHPGSGLSQPMNHSNPIDVNTSSRAKALTEFTGMELQVPDIVELQL